METQDWRGEYFLTVPRSPDAERGRNMQKRTADPIKAARNLRRQNVEVLRSKGRTYKQIATELKCSEYVVARDVMVLGLAK